MKFYTDTTYTIERNGAGESTSITWTFKDYNNYEIQKVEKVVDAEGTKEMIDWPVLSEDDLVATRSATYNIPEADRTTLAHGETHPHNHNNEIAFQEKYKKWWNDWELSL